MGASQVECNMRGAGARWPQVGTFPTFSGISAETFHFREFLGFRKFPGKFLLNVSWKILLKKTLFTIFLLSVSRAMVRAKEAANLKWTINMVRAKATSWMTGS